MTPRSDEELLRAFVGGDPTAFELLVRRHAAAVYQFVARFTKNAASTEDVVQETFLQISQSAAAFDGKRLFRPWLYTIAANKARDVLRASTRRREFVSDFRDDPDEARACYQDLLRVDVESPLGDLETDERRRAVRKIVDAMPHPLWEVLVLAYYHQFRYRQIAAILDMPLGTVKSRLHAAVAFLGREYRALRTVEAPAADEDVE